MLLPLTKSKRPVMKRDVVSVVAEGPNVVLHFGNTEVILPYETALQVSNWMRIRGKEAKSFAGDESRHWSTIGILSDPNQTRG